MAIIKQFDKRSGITYVYESIATWDKVKKRSVAKRTLIGKIDKLTGEMIPTDGRNKKAKAQITKLDTRCFYGATYLLSQIAQKTGVYDDLKKCFPSQYLQMLSLAYFLVLEDSSPLHRFSKWHLLHDHPFNSDILSQRSSDLFASITQDSCNAFFTRHAKRSSEKEYWFYDTTSISSFSKSLNQVKRGHNKEHDPFSQLNLALVFGEKSRLPLYYRKLAVNIPDVMTVKGLLADFEQLGFKSPKLVMDRGFMSNANVMELLKERVKFIQATKISLSYVRQELDNIYDNFRSFEHFDEANNVYSRTVRIKFDYEQNRPYKGDKVKESRRMYLHYYFNLERAAEEEMAFDRRLMQWRTELLTDNKVARHETSYAKYFKVHSTPKRGIQVETKDDVIAAKKRYMGFFSLISNEKMTALQALNLYRSKDLVEKSFVNLKERLNCRRALVSSEHSLNGKLFVQFIALILLSYIKKQMDDKGLFKKYTLQGVLDELDVIECVKAKGKQLRVCELLEKQRKLYEELGITPPSSL